VSDRPDSVTARAAAGFEDREVAALVGRADQERRPRADRWPRRVLRRADATAVPHSAVRPDGLDRSEGRKRGSFRVEIDADVRDE